MVQSVGGPLSLLLASLMQSLASEWVDRYQENSEKAMVELVQYFVLCCGCRAAITMEMFQNEDTTSVIRSLTENFDEVREHGERREKGEGDERAGGAVLGGDGGGTCWPCSHPGQWRLPSHCSWTHLPEVQGTA